jgi:soluble lytic murein transglycosylase-like protein
MSSDIGLGIVLLGGLVYFGYQAAETPATKQTGANFGDIFTAVVSTNTLGETPMPGANGNLTLQQVYQLAQALIAQYNFNVSPEMATGIAIIESGTPSFPQNGCNPNATKYEAALNDSSAGLMQVLSTTAQWIVTLGYNAFTSPSVNDLLNPQEGMYFGLAYLDYLSKYQGNAQAASFIVQSYNAGPGNASTAYLTSYNKAIAWLQQNGM